MQQSTADLLISAVQRGALEDAQRLLQDGTDPNTRNPADGLTVLMTAAGRGNVSMVRLLLEAGADVFSADSRAGGTALHKAVQGGDRETVRVLVEAGAFIDAVAPSTGHTPLMDALWYKSPDIVEYLLLQNAGLNLYTHYGFSLKEHFDFELRVNTLGKDKLLASEKLLKDRICRDEQEARDQKLMAAVVDNDLGRVQKLLAAGAEVDARYPHVNGFNDYHTPLLVAAREGNTEIVQALLAAGANVNASEPVFGAIPLHKAVYNGHADITRILVATPDADLNYQGATNGYTPLHDALWHGYEECARILVEAGASLDIVGHDGKTPYDIAVDTFGAADSVALDIERAQTAHRATSIEGNRQAVTS